MVTITTLCHQYLGQNLWLADGTQQAAERSCKYLAEAIGNKRIDRVNPMDSETYKGWLLKTGRSKATANLYLRSVHRVFQWSVETLGLLPENPIAVRQFRVTATPVRVYTDDEFSRMMRCVPDSRWAAMLLIGRTTGLRRAEVLNLRFENVRDGCVWVEPKRRTIDGWEWEPKDHEIRRVPLVEAVADAMAVRRGELPATQPYPNLTPRQYARMLELQSAGVLTRRRRNLPDNNFRRTFLSIQRAAFGRQIGDFHQLRKTYATDMIDVLPVHSVAKLTGHASIRTLVTHYLHSRESSLEIAREKASDGIKNAPHPFALSRKEVLAG